MGDGLPGLEEWSGRGWYCLGKEGVVLGRRIWSEEELGNGLGEEGMVWERRVLLRM